MNKALFLDRDGVLIQDTNLIKSISEVKVMPGISDLIVRFKKSGYQIFVITNQTVVSRGILTLDQAISLNDEILKMILKENAAAIIDKTYICPHHPNAQILEFRKNCNCRKPKSGMLLQAQQEFNIDLKNSVLVGDRPTDIYAGNFVGVRTYLFCSGAENEKLIESDLSLNSEYLEPTFKVTNLGQVTPELKVS